MEVFGGEPCSCLSELRVDRLERGTSCLCLSLMPVKTKVSLLSRHTLLTPFGAPPLNGGFMFTPFGAPPLDGGFEFTPFGAPPLDGGFALTPFGAPLLDRGFGFTLFSAPLLYRGFSFTPLGAPSLYEGFSFTPLGAPSLNEGFKLVVVDEVFVGKVFCFVFLVGEDVEVLELAMNSLMIR
jgi:hypothetical protein